MPHPFFRTAAGHRLALTVDGPADAPGAAGDDGDLALEGEVDGHDETP